MADQPTPPRTGLHLYGRCEGLSARQWSTDTRSGIEHSLGISFPFVNEFGMEQREIVKIAVGEKMLAHITQQANTLKGKVVSLRVGIQARKGGATGAWLRYYVPNDADLVPA